MSELGALSSTSNGDSRKIERSLRPAENALCGAISGMTCRLVISPFDVVKIRFQLQDHTLCSNKYEPPKYRHVIQSIKLIAKEEGWRSLWKGNMAAEVLYLTYSATQFFTYHEIYRRLDCMKLYLDWTKPSLISFVSGSTAGIIATLVSYPSDVLRTRLAIQKSPRVYTSLTHAVIGIYHKEGILGFYKGILPSLLQIVPFMGLTFMIFEATNEELNKFNLTSDCKKWNSFISGGIAGIISKTIVMPLDTIRKRMQLQGSDKSIYIGNKYPDYKGVWDCARNIYTKEGLFAFFKGLNPTLWKIAPSSAVAFLVFEKTKEIIISTLR